MKKLQVKNENRNNNYVFFIIFMNFFLSPNHKNKKQMTKINNNILYFIIFVIKFAKYVGTPSGSVFTGKNLSRLKKNTEKQKEIEKSGR